jgi:hypothetical protein
MEEGTTIYMLKSDLEDKKKKKKHTVKIGSDIEASYTIRDTTTYNKPFASSKEAVDYLENNPPIYTESEKKQFKRVLGNIASSYKEKQFYHEGFLSEEFKELKRKEEDDNTIKLSYDIPFTDEIKDIPTQCLTDPFYYVSDELKTILIQRSKTIREVYCGLSPFIIMEKQDRKEIEGTRLESIFEKYGIHPETIVKKASSGMFVLYCKLEEPYEDDMEEIQDKEQLPEIERRAAEMEAEQREYAKGNEFQPIIQQMTRETNIDLDDVDGVDEYVRSFVEMRIILKETRPEKNRLDNKLRGRFFVFVLFFFL